MCQVNGAGLMLVRVGRLAEALSHLEEALAVSRDLAAQHAARTLYPHLSSPILTYAHVC